MVILYFNMQQNFQTLKNCNPKQSQPKFNYFVEPKSRVIEKELLLGLEPRFTGHQTHALTIKLHLFPLIF